MRLYIIKNQTKTSNTLSHLIYSNGNYIIYHIYGKIHNKFDRNGFIEFDYTHSYINNFNHV